MALVGSMAVFLPAKSYADPQLDTLLNIATQARDSLGATISQMGNVPADISQLYNQGSDETDALAQAASQQDVGSAKQHFLAAMKFFKETNDKINSLNSTSTNDQQKAAVDELRGEVVRLQHMGTLLKSIATQNNVTIDFGPFDQMLQTASQDLNSGNTTDASNQIKSANDFIITTHNTLTQAAQEKISQRAKEFTERQIAQLNSNESNTYQQNNPSPSPPSPPANSPQQNNTVPAPPQNVIQPPTPNAPATGGNVTMDNNPKEMVAQLKKLVEQGKVEQAINLIKIIQAYQRENLAARESEISSQHAPVNTTIPTPQPQNNPPPPSSLPLNTTTPAPTRNEMPLPPVPAENNTTPTPPVPTPPVQTLPVPTPPVPTPQNITPQNTTVITPPQNNTLPTPPVPTPQPMQNNTTPTPPVPTPPVPTPQPQQNNTLPTPPVPKPTMPTPQNSHERGPPQNGTTSVPAHQQQDQNGRSDHRGPNHGHEQQNNFPWIQIGRHGRN